MRVGRLIWHLVSPEGFDQPAATIVLLNLLLLCAVLAVLEFVFGMPTRFANAIAGIVGGVGIVLGDLRYRTRFDLDVFDLSRSRILYLCPTWLFGVLLALFAAARLITAAFDGPEL